MSQARSPLREKLVAIEEKVKELQSEFLGKWCTEALSIVQGYIAALDATGSHATNEAAAEVVESAGSLRIRCADLVKSMRCLAENPHVLRDGVDIWPLYDVVMDLDNAVFDYDPRLGDYCPRDHYAAMHLYERASARVALCPVCSTEIVIPPVQLRGL